MEETQYAVHISEANRQVLDDLTRDAPIPEDRYDGSHYLVGSDVQKDDIIMTSAEFHQKYDILSSMTVHTIGPKDKT